MKSCSVAGCKTDDVHRVPNLFLHPFPDEEDMKKKWCLKLGRGNYTPTISSAVCSLHFSDNCFIGSRLRSNAMPTKYFNDWQEAVTLFNEKHNKDSKSNKEILAEIHEDISKMQTPAHMKHPMGCDDNNFPINNRTPETHKLWAIINKQANVIQRLLASNIKEESILAKQLAEAKAGQKELSRKMETYKYITKCLQEKQTTLEEQVEILSSVVSK